MRYRVWATAKDSDDIKVELLTANDENAAAIARAWMMSHPDDRIFLDDTTGENPPEYFVRAQSEYGYSIVGVVPIKGMWSDLPAMGYVEPGSAHDIVDLSRLA